MAPPAALFCVDVRSLCVHDISNKGRVGSGDFAGTRKEFVVLTDDACTEKSICVFDIGRVLLAANVLIMGLRGSRHEHTLGRVELYQARAVVG